VMDTRQSLDAFHPPLRLTRVQRFKLRAFLAFAKLLRRCRLV
jgi:hypothetical protein